ncbi:hypothetical protein [Spiroplasma taiwanense]|uniref:Uncharacterized protein n=1 Tax=Spiroplasma taiwanense CT-1 TaxID=1276220 RepID=S5LU89_9MOLU|nr:hypothetical protein [Spiroplasma taiwanense]AGR41324.1 hypothetical protein STAIW_v1c07100 [Spiroplasma taiwanense CT-1]
MEEVFILLNDAEKGSREGGIGFVSAIMNLWQMYALIINDHFSAYLNFDELEKKYKDYKFLGDFISEFNIWDYFLEFYDFWVENNGLPYGWIYAQEIKKDYDSVFGVSS